MLRVGYGIHLVLPAIPWLTAALVVGVIVGSVRPARPRLDGPLKPGLTVAARRLLRLGIVVLGLKLSLTDIAGLGAARHPRHRGARSREFRGDPADRVAG